MAEPDNLGSGKFFDGTSKYNTGSVDISGAGFGEIKVGETMAPFGARKGDWGPVHAVNKPQTTKKVVPPLSNDSFKIKNVSWRPPDNHKGRAARIAGALGTGAGIGAVANLFWGPAAAAYFMTGSIMKSASYNSDVFAKVSERIKNSWFIKFLGKSEVAKKVYHKALKPAWDGITDPDVFRLLLGAGLMLGGMFTGNPVMAYFGMTFSIFSAGEMVSKAVFNKTYGFLNGPTANKIGNAIDSAIIQKIVKKPGEITNTEHPSGVPAGDKKINKVKSLMNKASSYVYNNRGKIAKIALAATISFGAMAGFAVGTHAALGSTLGQMTVKTGDLTFWDKAKNTLIGGYRMYNLPGTVLKNGEQTQKFYQEMKVKYDPKTPQEWANVIEKEVTWVAHNDLYGTNIYHITSEEAARVVTLNGTAGRFSDCTGKGALLYNVLKMDGFGASEVVVGIPPLGYPDKVGHIWLVGRDASGKPVELFHYSNSQHMLRSQTFQSAEGIKGDRTAAFVAGGAGGLATKGIYGLLERIEAKIKGN
ncbi:hypothetical protein HY772_07525 [Candidatus Woesearchaeota archaeon]|nr:hypothetical protein [Candidatus Woesearchaeota archaeon]